MKTSAVKKSVKTDRNQFLTATRQSLHALPPELLDSLNLTVDSLLPRAPSKYDLYPPMLLLPKDSFSHPTWEALLSDSENASRFFASIAKSMKVSHIAANAPISLARSSRNGEHYTGDDEDFLRSPNINPLFGNFGPVVTGDPTSKDWKEAFWVSCRQNSITQVWAPRYTMFSRGNIAEKARIISLDTVAAAANQAEDEGKGCAAVDLYAGIGYFAFSYMKADIQKVLCWELNPWSVEGFRRGAHKNGWDVTVIDSSSPSSSWENDDISAFLLFNMDNQTAGKIIETARGKGKLLPIRHVNLGLLPTSRGSWETAVRVLDPELGGWIHLHENIGIKEIETKSENILEEIQVLIHSFTTSDVRGRKKMAILEHVERVKTYAPGVMHCVLDIRIEPMILRT